jgi:20S proteasome alpha/beta subunit
MPLESELTATPEMQTALQAAADTVKTLAEQFARGAHAPWMPAKGNRGQTIIVEHDDHGGVYVVNTDYAGHLYEWGSKNGPAYAPLRRAVRAAGLELTETPKR